MRFRGISVAVRSQGTMIQDVYMFITVYLALLLTVLVKGILTRRGKYARHIVHIYSLVCPTRFYNKEAVYMRLHIHT